MQITNVIERVEAQLSEFVNAERRNAFRALLCAPTIESRTWDWHDGREVKVCVFARAPAGRIDFAYCVDGYGDHWGVLFNDEASLGMDAQWYLYLEDAFVSSGAWHGSVEAGYELR